jgi:hypothetical protein
MGSKGHFKSISIVAPSPQGFSVMRLGKLGRVEDDRLPATPVTRLVVTAETV